MNVGEGGQYSIFSKDQPVSWIPSATAGVDLIGRTNRDLKGNGMTEHSEKRVE